MNTKSLKTLEYNKIINMLSEYASTDTGKALCLNLVPTSDLYEINKTQEETADALKRLWRNGRISFSGVKDVIASIKRLEVGGCLTAPELLHISKMLDVALRTKSFARDYRGGDDNYKKDSLDERFDFLEPLSNLNAEIRRCIISEEEVADDATPELKSIRRSIKNATEKIRNQMNAMVNSQTTRTFLQDYVITMRDDRYCLSVKSEYRSQIPGMIHDQSGSGSTLFIEPMTVVTLNNEIKTLRIKEQEEIHRVFEILSSIASEFTHELTNDFNILTELDFIFAKAGLAKALNCTKPIFNTEGKINLKDARHPLLNQKSVVPINIYLGDKFDQLIITGPNTGGKTVSLKTVGLLTLMGQAGLHIPAFEGSTLAVFTEIYADIGDEQSIEQNLSTFSSHMRNIVNIVDKADKDSLVLFDEICAGTDPIEGAALAISILTFLHRMQVRTMTTTHYSELKSFALSTEGIENACCEFSLETLSPTYRLLIGIPGKSNAFAISEKLGLPAFIIKEAKENIDSDSRSFEDVLADLENSRVSLEVERAELAEQLQEANSRNERLKNKLEKVDDRAERIIREATMKAEEILQDAKSFADETIRNINKYGSATKELENERHKIREKMAANNKNGESNAPKKVGTHSPSDFHIGDSVKVLSLNLNGTVSSLPNDKGDMYIQMGILRSQVNIKDLQIVDEVTITGPNFTKTGGGKVKFNKAATISTELNIIGRTTDEGIAMLDKYLDDAYLAHVPSVRIVHGRGTGALKKAVHAHIKRLKYVKSFRLGEFGEGGDGVTVVEFK